MCYRTKIENLNFFRFLDAVAFYKRAGPSIQLANILPRLRAAAHYSGIVELCLWAASARDPENRALVYVREGRPPSSEAETRAVQGRYDAYAQMIELFDWLREKSRMTLPPPAANSKTTEKSSQQTR